MTSSPLLQRMKRVVEAHPNVASVKATAGGPGFDLYISDSQLDVDGEVITIPPHPLLWLGEQLAEIAGPNSTIAYTWPGDPLKKGIAASFPAPIGSLWAKEHNDALVAPLKGDVAGVSATGSTTVGVADDQQFLMALASMGPALAHISQQPPLEALKESGLELAIHTNR